MKNYLKIISAFNEKKTPAGKFVLMSEFLESIENANTNMSHGDMCFILKKMIDTLLDEIQSRKMVDLALKIMVVGNEDLMELHYEKLYNVVYLSNPDNKTITQLWIAIQMYPQVIENPESDILIKTQNLISGINEIEDILQMFILTDIFEYQNEFWYKMMKMDFKKEHWLRLSNAFKNNEYYNISPEIFVSMVRDLKKKDLVDGRVIHKIILGISQNITHWDKKSIEIVVESATSLLSSETNNDSCVLIIAALKNQAYNKSIDLSEKSARILLNNGPSFENLYFLNLFGIFKYYQETDKVLKNEYFLDFQGIFNDRLNLTKDIPEEIMSDIEEFRDDPLCHLYLEFKKEAIRKDEEENKKEEKRKILQTAERFNHPDGPHGTIDEIIKNKISPY